MTFADVSGVEGDSKTFTVSTDQDVDGRLKVTPSFTDGTATKGTDYTVNTAALTVTGTAGETRTFTVSTTVDTVVEAAETFTVGLTVSGTSITVTEADTAIGTITDDDSVTVTIADASASRRGRAQLHGDVETRRWPAGLKVTPGYTDVTATKGTDYTENTAERSRSPGTAGETKTFTVSTTEDTVVEIE